MRNLCEGIDVVPSEGYSWNGWIAYLDKQGEPIEPYSFRAGSWWELMQHLEKCPKCRRANKISLEEVKKRLKEIEEEWRSVTDP